MRFKRLTPASLFLNGLVVVCTLILTFPLVWIVMMSLKQQAEVMTLPPRFVFTPTFENFRVLFDAAQAGATSYGTIKVDFLTPVANSVVISLGAVLVSLIAGVPAGYVAVCSSGRPSSSVRSRRKGSLKHRWPHLRRPSAIWPCWRDMSIA